MFLFQRLLFCFYNMFCTINLVFVSGLCMCTHALTFICVCVRHVQLPVNMEKEQWEFPHCFTVCVINHCPGLSAPGLICSHFFCFNFSSTRADTCGPGMLPRQRAELSGHIVHHHHREKVPVLGIYEPTQASEDPREVPKCVCL